MQTSKRIGPPLLVSRRAPEAPGRGHPARRRYRRTLRAALSVARRRGLVALNHAEGTMDAIPERNSGTDTTLMIREPEKTARFLEHVSDDRLAALYELAAYGGMRRAELCGLRWSDLDEGGPGLTVRQTIVEPTCNQARPGDLTSATCGEVHVGRYVKTPESKQGRRWIPLAPPASTALATHRVAQQAEGRRSSSGGRSPGHQTRREQTVSRPDESAAHVAADHDLEHRQITPRRRSGARGTVMLVVRPAGFEPATDRLEVCCSIR
jgi:integrase